MPSADEIERARVAIYASFATTGRAPSVPELARAVNLDASQTRSALTALHSSRDIVLSPAALSTLSADPNSATHDTDGALIVMAHPFASIPLGFSVMGTDTLWWGGCGWDAFALPFLVPCQAPVLVATRCPGCDKPLALDVGVHYPPPTLESPKIVMHFLTPMARAWDDVVHTCANQRLFCSETCLDVWLVRSGHSKGYVMSIETLWHFAKGWYAGRMENGYQRREPSEAKEYFRSVGLSGAFWGL